jgi:hypothetical protein
METNSSRSAGTPQNTRATWASWIQGVGFGIYILASLGLLFYAASFKRLGWNWLELRPYVVGIIVMGIVLFVLSYGLSVLRTANLSERVKLIAAITMILCFSAIVLAGTSWIIVLIWRDAASTGTTSSPSHQELSALLKGNHRQIKLKLDALSIGAEDQEQFNLFRNEIEHRLDSIKDANDHGQEVRFREESKSLVDYLNTEEAKKVIPADILEKFKTWCYELPKNDAINDRIDGASNGRAA